MTDTSSPDAAVVRQAITWWARLQSGEADEGLRAACTRWIDADPAHRAAWQRVDRVAQGVSRVPSGLAHAALDRPSRSVQPQRRAVLRALAAGVVVAGAGGLAYRHTPWQRLIADYSTATGETRDVALAEGLTLTLAGDTAIRTTLQEARRGISLLRGEMLVRAAHLAVLQPVLDVDTGFGVVSAEEARFCVRRMDSGCRIDVYEGIVALQRDAMPGTLLLRAGESLIVGGDGAARAGVADPDATAWTQGVVVAQAWPLARLVQRLADNRVGLIRVDERVASLPISGVFPLYDAERALAAVARTLPIAVQRRSRYWLSVGPREA
ncbi:DUF4880 domain-containing protein [Pseudomonadota bacterium AL_CKDN230030165-1A_HGKHYDSX7]